MAAGSSTDRLKVRLGRSLAQRKVIVFFDRPVAPDGYSMVWPITAEDKLAAPAGPVDLTVILEAVAERVPIERADAHVTMLSIYFSPGALSAETPDALQVVRFAVVRGAAQQFAEVEWDGEVSNLDDPDDFAGVLVDELAGIVGRAVTEVTSVAVRGAGFVLSRLLGGPSGRSPWSGATDNPDRDPPPNR
jgi:hypothetical protein